MIAPAVMSMWPRPAVPAIMSLDSLSGEQVGERGVEQFFHAVGPSVGDGLSSATR